MTINNKIMWQNSSCLLLPFSRFNPWIIVNYLRCDASISSDPPTAKIWQSAQYFPRPQIQFPELSMSFPDFPGLWKGLGLSKRRETNIVSRSEVTRSVKNYLTWNGVLEWTASVCAVSIVWRYSRWCCSIRWNTAYLRLWNLQTWTQCEPIWSKNVDFSHTYYLQREEQIS